jgi:hypothetical protein
MKFFGIIVVIFAVAVVDHELFHNECIPVQHHIRSDTTAWNGQFSLHKAY